MIDYFTSAVDSISAWMAKAYAFRGERGTAVRQLQVAIEPMEFEAMCRHYLAHKDEIIQRLAILECQQRRFIGASDKLWEIVHDPTAGDNRFYALRCLGEFRDLKVVDICEKLLSHGTLNERSGAVIALGGIGTDKGKRLLDFSMESDADPHVQLLAALSLVRLGSERAVTVLEDRIGLTSGIVRVVMASALACAGSAVGKRAALDIVDHGTIREKRVLRQSFIHIGEGRIVDDNWEQAVRDWCRPVQK